MDPLASQSPEVLPYARRHPQEFGRGLRVALVLAWVYPLLPLGALYATWAVAWMVLGHRPRFGQDDPGGINVAVTAAGVIAGLLVVTAPLGALAGMILTPWWVYCRGGRIGTSAFLVLVLLAWYAAATVFLEADPFRVLYWFTD
jgi:hypothetical protein